MTDGETKDRTQFFTHVHQFWGVAASCVGVCALFEVTLFSRARFWAEEQGCIEISPSHRLKVTSAIPCEGRDHLKVPPAQAGPRSRGGSGISLGEQRLPIRSMLAQHAGASLMFRQRWESR